MKKIDVTLDMLYRKLYDLGYTEAFVTFTNKNWKSNYSEYLKNHQVLLQNLTLFDKNKKYYYLKVHKSKISSSILVEIKLFEDLNNYEFTYACDDIIARIIKDIREEICFFENIDFIV